MIDTYRRMACIRAVGQLISVGYNPDEESSSKILLDFSCPGNVIGWVCLRRILQVRKNFLVDF